MSQNSNSNVFIVNPPVSANVYAYSFYNSLTPLLTICLLCQFLWLTYNQKVSLSQQLKIHVYVWIIGAASSFAYTGPTLIGLLWKGGSFLVVACKAFKVKNLTSKKDFSR